MYDMSTLRNLIIRLLYLFSLFILLQCQLESVSSSRPCSKEFIYATCPKLDQPSALDLDQTCSVALECINTFRVECHPDITRDYLHKLHEICPSHKDTPENNGKGTEDVTYSGRCTSKDLIATCKLDHLKEVMPKIAEGFVVDSKAWAEECEKAKGFVQCLRAFKKTCPGYNDIHDLVDPKLNDYYDEICSPDSEIAKGVRKFSSCLDPLAKELDKCFDESREYMEEISKDIPDSEELSDEEEEQFVKPFCCANIKGLKCREDVILPKCGPEAAVFAKNMQKKVVHPFAEMCKKYEAACIKSLSEEQEATTASPNGKGSATVVSASLLIIGSSNALTTYAARFTHQI